MVLRTLSVAPEQMAWGLVGKRRAIRRQLVRRDRFAAEPAGGMIQVRPPRSRHRMGSVTMAN